MSLLPQRKKSAEEIAKLRESLGIPGQPSGEEAMPAAAMDAVPESAVPIVPSVPSEEPEMLDLKSLVPDAVLEVEVPVVLEAEAPVVLAAEQASAPATLAPLPFAPPAAHSRQVRSLKRSERVPVLTQENSAPVVEPPSAPQGKLVRSLRKSEQVPVTPADIHPPAPDSSLPVHRHSDRELNEIRRQAAITMSAPAIPPTVVPAHPALIVPGYLFAIAAAACFSYYHLSIAFTAGCLAVALIVAGVIFVKRPVSRHHAAFISVIALLVIVFGALHYFPQLRHGT